MRLLQVLLDNAGPASGDAERRRADLAPQYATLVLLIELMVLSLRRRVGPDERDELYVMMMSSVRAQLLARLPGNAGVAAEWRAAMGGILDG